MANRIMPKKGVSDLAIWTAVTSFREESMVATADIRSQ